MQNPDKLRELALWYREFAERAGSAAIWDARLRTAEELEVEAQRIERALVSRAASFRVWDVQRLS